MRLLHGRGAIGKNLLVKAHKNLDFVLGRDQNQGNIAVSDTKMPILCSKCPKMGVSKAKSAQKPRFCAREERGVGNSSARNLVLGGLREAPGAEAVLPKWRRRGVSGRYSWALISRDAPSGVMMV